VRKSKAELGPPPVHARLRVQHKEQVMTSRESDSESQYSHDNLTDNNLTEDEREEVRAQYTRQAVVQSEALTSAKLVESVQVRETEEVRRREEEVRQRQHAQQQHAQHGFDVTLRTSEAQQLGYSDEDTMSMSEYTGQDLIEPVLIQRGDRYSQHASQTSQQLEQHLSQHISREQHLATSHHVSKFDVLIRVLDAPPVSAGGTSDRDDLTSVFSEDDKQKWRDIVTHDTTFRTMIEAAQTTEEVELAVNQMRYTTVYEKMFEPHKWDVIVRVLRAPGSISGKSASSRSVSGYTGRSGKSATEFDLRSVAETTVDFGARRSEFDSGSSVSGRSGRYSAHHSTGARSMADRSGTEITEYHSYMYAESHGTRSEGRSESRPSFGHLTSDEQEEF